MHGAPALPKRLDETKWSGAEMRPRRDVTTHRKGVETATSRPRPDHINVNVYVIDINVCVVSVSTSRVLIKFLFSYRSE